MSTGGMETLPTFRYQPDPIATGSIVASPVTCRACQRARGYIYAGAVYSQDELKGSLCPWCIADGSAHERFGAEFTDADGTGGDFESWFASLDATGSPVAYISRCLHCGRHTGYSDCD